MYSEGGVATEGGPTEAVVFASARPHRRPRSPAIVVERRKLSALFTPGEIANEHGLVENRKLKEPSSDGLYSYYRAASLGEGILERGVRELMREEWKLLDAYSE